MVHLSGGERYPPFEQPEPWGIVSTTSSIPHPPEWHKTDSIAVQKQITDDLIFSV